MRGPCKGVWYLVWGSIQVLAGWWGWLCSPCTLHLPSLFPHSLLLSSLCLTIHCHPLRPMVGLGVCPVCLHKVVVKRRDEENQHECIDQLMELLKFYLRVL